MPTYGLQSEDPQWVNDYNNRDVNHLKFQVEVLTVKAYNLLQELEKERADHEVTRELLFQAERKASW